MAFGGQSVDGEGTAEEGRGAAVRDGGVLRDESLPRPSMFTTCGTCARVID